MILRPVSWAVCERGHGLTIYATLHLQRAVSRILHCQPRAPVMARYDQERASTQDWELFNAHCVILTSRLVRRRLERGQRGGRNQRRTTWNAASIQRPTLNPPRRVSVQGGRAGRHHVRRGKHSKTDGRQRPDGLGIALARSRSARPLAFRFAELVWRTRQRRLVRLGLPPPSGSASDATPAGSCPTAERPEQTTRAARSGAQTNRRGPMLPKACPHES